MPVAPDLSVFGKNQGFSDYQRANEEFQLKKALAVQAAQKNMLETQALQAQAANGGLTVKDMLTMQMQQQNNAENRDIRREALDIQRANAAANIDLRRESIDVRRDEKEAKKQAAQDVKTQGKQDFEDGLANIAASYTNLKDMGGITSVNEGGLSNLGSAISSSRIGQATGGLFGTAEQSERNKIAGAVPLLTQSIKNATGMSAQQMNSNVELQTFLKALGDPKNDYEANLEILKNLSDRFGTGEVAATLGSQKGKGGNEPAKPVVLSTDAPKLTGNSAIIKTQAQYDALPSGAAYVEVGDDGKPMKMRKP